MSGLYLFDKNLKTLKGLEIPSKVDGYFNCSFNSLKSLEFGPVEVETEYMCTSNVLTSLKFCATKIGDEFHAKANQIENLKDIHKQFKNGYINGDFFLDRNPLKSHLLGVILIPRLKEITIDNNGVQNILNKHFRTRDVLECQEELIQNGYKEFAQL